ncbi:MAG: hypothetical protein WDN30_04740 [Pararobbsia sp.]
MIEPTSARLALETFQLGAAMDRVPGEVVPGGTQGDHPVDKKIDRRTRRIPLTARPRHGIHGDAMHAFGHRRQRALHFGGRQVG